MREAGGAVFECSGPQPQVSSLVGSGVTFKRLCKG